ncbi:MAG: hypothetical protein IJQ81_18180 [Oscillibacter sp.]|nr:hypothetical protein [Oscillibacter sp.]
MYFVLKLIFIAAVTGNLLLLCMAVALLLILKRSRSCAREQTPDPPSERERQRTRTAREDAEAWRQLQAYTADDAYGTGGSA